MCVLFLEIVVLGGYEIFENYWKGIFWLNILIRYILDIMIY